MENIGKILVVFGVVMILLGAALTLGSRIPLLGRLPGDIHLRWGSAEIYIPLATSILLSIVLTIVLNLVLAVLRR
jgi:hypothetical protein